MRRFLLSMCCILLFTMNGCFRNDENTEVKSNVSIAGLNNSKNEKHHIILYYADMTGSYLVPEEREVELNKRKIEELIINELIKVSSKDSLTAEVPYGTKLISAKKKDKTVFVNFNKAINSGKSDDVVINSIFIASIVNSLTELPGISNVQLLIEGREIGSPLKRMRNKFKRENLNPSEVLKKQMTLEKKYDWVNAYMLMSDDENSNGRKYYDEYVKEIEEARDENLLNADFEVGSYTVDLNNDNKAVVKVNFITRDSNGVYVISPDVFFDTVKIDGYWRVEWLSGNEIKGN